jgi:hypothetical protein
MMTEKDIGGLTTLVTQFRWIGSELEKYVLEAERMEYEAYWREDNSPETIADRENADCVRTKLSNALESMWFSVDEIEDVIDKWKSANERASR